MTIVESKRKVVGRSPHRRVGYIFCPWLQAEAIEHESLLEKDFVRIALLCPDLLRIRSQPFTLELADGARYTPDFELTFSVHPPIVVEVKPRGFVAKHRLMLRQAAAILEDSGRNFVVATEDEIQRAGRSERAALFLRAARAPLDLMAKQAGDRLHSLTYPISSSGRGG